MLDWLTPSNAVNLGFSVAVATYLLWFLTNHLRHKLDDMHETLKENNSLMKELLTVIKGWRRDSQ